MLPSYSESVPDDTIGIEVHGYGTGRQAISELAANKVDIALATEEAFSSAIRSDSKIKRRDIVRLCDVSQGSVCFHLQSRNEISRNQFWELLENNDRNVAVVACPPETNYASLTSRMNVRIVHIENAESEPQQKELASVVRSVNPQLVLLIGLPNWIENIVPTVISLQAELRLTFRRDYTEAAKHGWLGMEEYGLYVNRDLLDGVSYDLNGEKRDVTPAEIYATLRRILGYLRDISENDGDLKQLVTTLKHDVQTNIQRSAGGSLSGLMSATRTRVNLRPTRHVVSCWENEVSKF
jgi:hypothetical protein